MTSPEHVQQARNPLNEIQQLSARIHNNPSAYSKSPSDTASCKKTIHIGIFFDGTDNNMKRDTDEGKKGYTNIVSLLNAYEDNKKKGYYQVYVEGVGTPFKIGGEEGELANGKSNGEGGGKRIYYAVFQVLNIVNIAVNNKSIISDKALKSQLVNNFFPDGGRVELGLVLTPKVIFERLLEKLSAAIKNKNPNKPTKLIIKEINISVFGFSRGAAQARAFVNVFHKAVGESGELCGIKTNFSFLGLFETVASVGIPASTPGLGGSLAFGLTSWADETMKIHDNVKRCVHFVGAQEIRASFPLSSIMYRGDYPENSKEVVYPGVHSDIGGGYAPGDQGKSIDSISNEEYQDHLLELYEYNYKLRLEKAQKWYDEVRSPNYHDAGYSALSYYGQRLRTAFKTTEENLQAVHEKWRPLIKKHKKSLRTKNNRLKLGKSRQSLLSQIPLRHMYEEAYKYVLPLISYSEMKTKNKATYEDFKVNPTIENLLNDYIKLFNKKITDYKQGSTPKMKELTNLVLRSQELHLRWRWHMALPSNIENLSAYENANIDERRAWHEYSLKSIMKLKSFSAANRQEKVDLEEGNKDYLLDMWEIFREEYRTLVHKAYTKLSNDGYFPFADIQSEVNKSPACRYDNTELIDKIAYQQTKKTGDSDMPTHLNRLFDEYVHDSHSGFYIAGPRSAFERQEFYEDAKKRVNHETKLYSYLPPVIVYKNLTNNDDTEFDRDLVKQGVDNFPLMTDAKGSQLRTILLGGTQHIMSKKKCRPATRREAGGHVKERLLMDSNKG